ncbi:MAG: hypothetical protein E7417_04640 [Ruminococcaceae bacterium]|nr:hypothetical protein [Oscillospiraceae bacterium]
MYRKYYSYSDMPQLVPKRENKECIEKKEPLSLDNTGNGNGKILGKFESDDLLLAVVIIALLLDDGGDTTLILALCVIFLSGLL